MTTASLSDKKTRCTWVPEDNALYEAYHDEEWGYPVVDSRELFEAISLESFQSGLSWLTILKKRETFRAAFKNFVPEQVVDLNVEELVLDSRIVRHRGKINATINNARVILEMQKNNQSFAELIWKYEEVPYDDDGEEIAARAKSENSERLSKDLKKMGWKFLGPTTAYAFMQSVGLVNDHSRDCFARPLVAAARAKLGKNIQF